MILHRRRLASVFATLAVLSSGSASLADEPNVLRGRARTYEALAPNSLEDSTPAEAILGIRHDNVSPSRIWKLLEHGEKVECLSCVPVVAKRLFDDHPKTREISAWWLRRRVFGVFGPGEVYSRVVNALNDPEESERRRAYAANAIGEFLSPAGVRHVARASIADPSPRVREAAIQALARLNHEGPELELGAALADPDENVRLSALQAALSVRVFSSVPDVVRRIDDPSPRVRRRAAEALGAMRVADSAAALAVLTDPNSEATPEVRQAAVWALGQLGDSAARPAVEAALDDPSSLVRDTARIALRRM